MSWLPRVSFHGWTSCSSTAEYEGWSIELTWGPIVIELAIGKVDRTFSDEADEAGA